MLYHDKSTFGIPCVQHVAAKAVRGAAFMAGSSPLEACIRRLPVILIWFGGIYGQNLTWWLSSACLSGWQMGAGHRERGLEVRQWARSPPVGYLAQTDTTVTRSIKCYHVRWQTQLAINCVDWVHVWTSSFWTNGSVVEYGECQISISLPMLRNLILGQWGRSWAEISSVSLHLH